MPRDAYDIFVMPSVDLGGGVHEGIPVALMEAMSAQVAVVATDTGGIPELVIDKVTGRLVLISPRPRWRRPSAGWPQTSRGRTRWPVVARSTCGRSSTQLA